MRYETIRGIDKPLSKLVFGCAIGPMLMGEDVNALLDGVYAQGITTFDTARQYGRSEEALGRWLRARSNREKVVLITKGCHPYEDGIDRVSPAAIREDIEQSLETLGTDYIDIYFLHRDDLKVEVGPIVETLNEYHKAGKIGVFGGSNWTHQRIAEANAYAGAHGLLPFMVSSPNFGLCNQVDDPYGGGAGCVTISGPANADVRAWYAKSNIPVFAYSSLGRGMFSGKVKSDDMEGARAILDPFAIKGYLYPENFERLRRAEELAAKKGCTVPQIALAWILQQELQVFALVSSTRAQSMEANVRALEVELTPEEIRWLDLRN